ncbi:MAG: GNAT family N-acetyltransferase [Thermoguttaceae bacterium]
MPRIVEINQIEGLAPLADAWDDLLRQTPGASFFQSLAWLQAYWRHFGAGQLLRVLIREEGDRPTGILPLVVRHETSKVGPLRVVTFPLHAWGSFYGPIGPEPCAVLAAGLDHLRHTKPCWDVLELRWQGAPSTAPRQLERTLIESGFSAQATVWDRASVVDLDGDWETYRSTRNGAWLRRLRHDERKLSAAGRLEFVRYRPAGAAYGDGSPRWDLYDACEDLARRSWQGSATDGTTLSHESVRGFLREVHESAAKAGAVDMSLLLLDDAPLAFIYGYQYGGYVYGLRRGRDAERASDGAGNLLLARTLEDSFARGDRLYDMGVGSLASKRQFQTRLIPILRLSHYPLRSPRAQLLRLARWWQGRTICASRLDEEVAAES